jgi:hypothetical protein
VSAPCERKDLLFIAALRDDDVDDVSEEAIKNERSLPLKTACFRNS